MTFRSNTRLSFEIADQARRVHGCSLSSDILEDVLNVIAHKCQGWTVKFKDLKDHSGGRYSDINIHQVILAMKRTGWLERCSTGHWKLSLPNTPTLKTQKQT